MRLKLCLQTSLLASTLALAAGAVGCGDHSAPTIGVPGPSASEDPVRSASGPDNTGDGGPSTTTCTGEQALDLVRTEYAGSTLAFYVPVEAEGRSGLLHLDSAGAYTILFAPEAKGWVNDYANVRIGCELGRLPGYGGLAAMEDIEGRPVLGTMGADWFLAEPTLLDVAAGQLVRRPNGRSVTGSFEVPYRVLQGAIVIDAIFDGKAVSAMLDTGSGHALIVDETPRPGETKITTSDALGNPLVVYQSTATLGIAGHEKVVPILRAAKFDILEELSNQMGVRIGGLVGLSSLRAIETDPAKGVLKLAL